MSIEIGTTKPELTDLVGLPLRVGDKFAFAAWGYGVPSSLCQSYCVITRITRTGGIEYESNIELEQKRTLAAKHVKTMTRKVTDAQAERRDRKISLRSEPPPDTPPSE